MNSTYIICIIEIYHLLVGFYDDQKSFHIDEQMKLSTCLPLLPSAVTNSTYCTCTVCNCTGTVCPGHMITNT
jgi:hypothetical protein